MRVMHDSTERRQSTLAVHAGCKMPRIEGSVTTPIFQGTVFEHTGATDYADIRYPRLSNLPNHVQRLTTTSVTTGLGCGSSVRIAVSGRRLISAAGPTGCAWNHLRHAAGRGRPQRKEGGHVYGIF